ncbi:MULTISPECIES: hypothetical protein [unclassified Streptomyces]|uniref:hypothetical protein n=1 Tax=unclassified Streptomyces TaxID=2593676 RepID=UPI00225899DF|nr:MULTISPECIES: hypothetical protein [unclassified Streptomyces]MCX5063762.1 hypothetical protein [Streptomyces sp. NBC_00452]MCX5294180.1 hypothetical protein [Streptomyces sp. NBC_00183]
MRRTLAATAAVLAALICAGCSSSSSPKSSPAPTGTDSGLDAAKYLNGLEGDKHSKQQIDALLGKLDARCADDLGALTAAATVTATNVTDAKGTQTTYGVLQKLADGLPSSGKASCQKRLPGVEKQLKAGR